MSLSSLRRCNGNPGEMRKGFLFGQFIFRLNDGDLKVRSIVVGERGHLEVVSTGNLKLHGVGQTEDKSDIKFNWSVGS